MSWIDEVVVTASNPAPGKQIPVQGSQPDASGNFPTISDEGVGLNVYIAGGTGVSGAIPVTFGSGTISISASAGEVKPKNVNLTTVSWTSSSVTLLTASSVRLGFNLFNNSDAAAVINFGLTASADSWIFFLNPGSYYESPFPSYIGAVSAFWVPSAGPGSGTLQVTELLP